MHRRQTVLSAALFATLGAGCGLSAVEEPAGGTTHTLTNCGRSVAVATPPDRAVSLNQGSTEILLSLGLGDRLVGTATWTDPVLPALEEANAKIPRLSDNVPSFEIVLEQNPDFVTASFASTLDAGGVATRDQFEKLGVSTYVAPTSCEGKSVSSADGPRDHPFTIDLVYREIEELSTIFGVESAGTELVTSLQDRLAAAVQTQAEGTTALFWFANSESPYMAGCCGAPGLIADELGLTNVFDDESDEWPQINWESVAERNPDVLVIGDLTRKSESAETADAKIAFLKSNPVTREMTAVRHDRYILVSGAELNPSLRTVQAIETIAEGLNDLGLAD